MRVIFMGTPEFALPPLEALSESFEIAAVYTRPDRAAGRGRSLTSSPVKKVALARGWPVEQPRSLRLPDAISRLRDHAPDLIVVAAYGLILPPAVLDLPPYHCINVHASLLPRHRGASPITFALLEGDAETGVTLMQMDAGLDTGPIIAARALPILPAETAPSLSSRLSRLGAELLREFLPLWFAGKTTPVQQDSSRATLTRLIRKEDGKIDWNRSAVEIERMVRAFDPWPGAYTYWGGRLLKLLKASVQEHSLPGKPGKVLKIDDGVGVVTRNGILCLIELQLEGKRQMSVFEFLRGQPDFIGAILGRQSLSG